MLALVAGTVPRSGLVVVGCWDDLLSSDWPLVRADRRTGVIRREDGVIRAEDAGPLGG